MNHANVVHYLSILPWWNGRPFPIKMCTGHNWIRATLKPPKMHGNTKHWFFGSDSIPIFGSTHHFNCVDHFMALSIEYFICLWFSDSIAHFLLALANASMNVNIYSFWYTWKTILLSAISLVCISEKKLIFFSTLFFPSSHQPLNILEPCSVGWPVYFSLACRIFPSVWERPFLPPLSLPFGWLVDSGRK